MRDSVESPWASLFYTDPLAFDAPFRPVGYGSEQDVIYNIAWDTQTQTWALHRESLTGEPENQRLFAHDAVDVDLVDTMGRYNRVVSAAFLDGRSRRAIVDPRVAEVY